MSRNHASLDTATTGPSIKNQVAQKKDDNPYKIALSKFIPKVGDELHVRILSLNPEHTRRLEVVYSQKRVEPKGGKAFTTNVETHYVLIAGDPEEVIKQNDLSGFNGRVYDEDNRDWSNVNLAELPSKSKYRIPCYVYGVSNKKGFDDECAGIMFLELSYPQWMDLKATEKSRNVDLTWDEETGKPMYDIVIARAKERGEGTYSFEGLAFDEPGVKASGYNVSDKEALGDDVYATVKAKYTELQDAMDEFQTPEQIRYALGGSTRAGGAMQTKPTMPVGDDEGADQDENRNNTDPVENEDVDRQPEAASRGRGRTQAAATEKTQESKPAAEEADTDKGSFGFSRAGRRGRNAA